MSENTNPSNPKRRAPGSAWKPGQSGNPGGRPKTLEGLRELCREHAGDAVAALVLALKDPKTRVPAAQVLLDRGFGRVPQKLLGDVSEPMRVVYTFESDKDGQE